MQKSGTVLPHTKSGTTAYGADVKNYIRPYYRSSSCAWPEDTVLPLPQSGTTVSTCSTTAGDCGTTARAYGTTAPESSTTACPRSATLGVLHFAETQRNGGCPKEPKERWCKKEQTCTC